MKFVKYFFTLLIAVALFSCGGNGEGDNSNGDTKDSTNVEVADNKKKESKPAISLWDNSLREEASRKGKWITTILFGEEVTFLGDTIVNSGEKREYMKVELVDGKKGWVNMYLYAMDAKRAVVSSPVALYKRPDISTSAGETIDRGEVIAISGEQDGWYEVFNKEKKKKGWIKGANSVTEDEVDVAVALMIIRALAEEDVDKQKQKLEQIIANPDFESSIFYETARTELENINFANEDGGLEEGEGDIEME